MMRQVYAAGSWVFGWLAIALLVVGTLAAPTQKAFADSGDCSQRCNDFCAANFMVGSPEYNSCVSQCLPMCTGGTCDQCPGTCSGYYPLGTQQYNNCVASCQGVCAGGGGVVVAVAAKCSDDTTTCPESGDPAFCKGTAGDCQKGTCKCKQEKTSCPCIPK